MTFLLNVVVCILCTLYAINGEYSGVNVVLYVAAGLNALCAGIKVHKTLGKWFPPVRPPSLRKLKVPTSRSNTAQRPSQTDDYPPYIRQLYGPCAN